MTEKLKIVFHVEDANKQIVVPAMQTWLEFESLAVLAIDKVEALREKLRAIEAGQTEGLAFTMETQATHRDEIIDATGFTIARFLRLKLREWARDLLKERM